MKPTVARAAPVAAKSALTLTARVTRTETIAVGASEHGDQSIGQFVDEYFQGVARDDGTCEFLELAIDPDTFRAIYCRQMGEAS